jgi:hypothetical protein
MLRTLALIALTLAASSAMAAPIVVNCDVGQSLNRTLSRLDKHTPPTVWVKGTCTEYVQVTGFDGLTLKGFPGATLVWPSAAPANNLFTYLLLISASRSVTIDGLRFQAPSDASVVGVGQGSLDVRLRNLTVQGGGWAAIAVFENSQVSIARVTVRDATFGVAVVDASDVHIEDCLFENTTGAPWHEGLSVGAAHVTMHGTIFRNMQNGIQIYTGGIVDVVNSNTYYPLSGPSEVLIESPVGTYSTGVSITDGASLNFQNNSAKLRITNPGPGRGVEVLSGSTLNAGASLVVSGSHGQGVFVTNNSHADLNGSSITGSYGGGLVVVNLSTAAVGGSAPTEISGNAVDVFCDSRSLITGGANIANATTVQCDNLLAGQNEPIP